MNAQAAGYGDGPLSPWFEAIVAKYGPVLLGIFVGTSAKYALLLAEGRKLTLRILAVDVLLLGMVVLLTYNVVLRLGASGDAAAMLGALFAVSSDRVIRLVRERFLRRVDAELRVMASEQIGEVRKVVQAERSGAEILHDHAIGAAPTDYEALRKPRRPQ